MYKTHCTKSKSDLSQKQNKLLQLCSSPVSACAFFFPAVQEMARSSALVTKTRTRKSLRLQNIEPPSPVVAVARARRRSINSTETSSGVSSSQNSNDDSSSSNNDNIGRRLRSSDASFQSGNRQDRKPSAAVLKNSTNTQKKKRRSSSRTRLSSSKEGDTNKRRKSGPGGRNVEKKKKDPPQLAKRQLELNQVTPSPASTKSSTTSSFNFNSPLPKKRLVAPSLPRGVVNLYPTNSKDQKQTRRWGEEHCSASALTSSYLRSYGEEYFSHLKKHEAPIIDPPTSTSPKAESPASSLFASPGSTSSSTSNLSSHTPVLQRSHVYIDTSCLGVDQPVESTQFLHYQPDLTPKMRAILVDWIIELSEHFNFGPAALHLSITLIDKVLACGPLSLDSDEPHDHEDEDTESKTNCFLISRERFQLLGATCTWLACKMEELSPPTVSEIAYVSDNIYSTEQIKRMERRICTALNFNLIHTSPYPFTSEFVRASGECSDVFCPTPTPPMFEHMVMYLLELGRLPFVPVTKKPSLLSAAAIYIARVSLGIQSKDKSLDPLGRWTKTLLYYTGYNKAELKDVVLAIHSYHIAAESSSLKSVFSKYKSRKFSRVALKTVPIAEDLGFS